MNMSLKVEKGRKEGGRDGDIATNVCSEDKRCNPMPLWGERAGEAGYPAELTLQHNRAKNTPRRGFLNPLS